MATFMATLNGVSKNFKDVYKDLTGGNADRIYGITMDAGESKVMAIELPQNN